MGEEGEEPTHFCDPESELRLSTGRREKRRTKLIKGMGEKKREKKRVRLADGAFAQLSNFQYR